MDTNEAERLGQLVVARRMALGMRTSTALAEAAGLTTRVIGDLETGRRTNFSASTRAAIEQALDWAIGSIEETLNGGEPRPYEAPPPRTIRIRKEDDGVWREVKPRDPSAPRKTKDERAQELSETTRQHAQMVGSILSLPVDLTDDERGRVEHIRREIERLPDVLAPWIDTPVGVNQFMHQISALIKEARDILAHAVSEKYGDDAAHETSAVTSLAERRKPVGPPPSLDEIGVAASRREKQSDRDRDDETD